MFYDGSCPLCRMEVNHLKRDDNGTVHFVDVDKKEFGQQYPQLNKEDLNAKLHCYSESDGWITGLDANVAIWKSLGKGHWVKWLRWPIIRPIADWGYRAFAKYRKRLF